MTSDPSILSSSALFSRLRDVRLSQRRDAAVVLRFGEELIERGQLNKDSDQVWDAMEQIATAAVECGQLSLATVLVSRLAARFSDRAPRVAVLQGMLLEGKGELRLAREFYEVLLRESETNVAARKRLAALHLSSPLTTLPSSSESLSPSLRPYFDASLSLSKGIQVLTHYLDTYYLDAPAWSTLSSAYARLGLYPQALSAAGHAVLLQPQNTWTLLKHAETAYTAGEVETAWKEYLKVVEMSDDDGKGLQGAGRRAAIGANLCLPRLRASSSKPSFPTASSDPLLIPAHLDKMELLLTRLLLENYSKTDGAVGGGLVRNDSSLHRHRPIPVQQLGEEQEDEDSSSDDDGRGRKGRKVWTMRSRSKSRHKDLESGSSSDSGSDDDDGGGRKGGKHIHLSKKQRNTVVGVTVLVLIAAGGFVAWKYGKTGVTEVQDFVTFPTMTTPFDLTSFFMSIFSDITSAIMMAESVLTSAVMYGESVATSAIVMAAETAASAVVEAEKAATSAIVGAATTVASAVVGAENTATSAVAGAAETAAKAAQITNVGNEITKGLGGIFG
ncbi:hypothetical protein JCM8547_007146 [Rhodosporidiobolus lusitaniae]